MLVFHSLRSPFTNSFFIRFTQQSCGLGRMERDAPILQMKSVRRRGKPHRLSRAVPSPGPNPEVSPPPWSDPPPFLWRGASRHQTNPTSKRNVRSHRIHINLLKRAPASPCRLSFLLLAYLLNVTASVPKALPENRLPAGGVGDAVKWSNLEEGRGVREGRR